MGCLATLLLAAGSESAAVAHGNAEPGGPYLGRWDVTLHTPARDYSSWLDIQENGGRLRVRMVGRWGHARWLPQAAIASPQRAGRQSRRIRRRPDTGAHCIEPRSVNPTAGGIR